MPSRALRVFVLSAAVVELAACGSLSSKSPAPSSSSGAKHTLTINLDTGGATGGWGVKADPPGTTYHALTQTVSYDNGTSVTLTAIATANWPFEGWSGDASGTACSVTLTMNADKTVTAKIPLQAGAAANCP